MTLSMARKFAFQNLKANRLLEIPFVLSSGIMLMLFYIMASLLNNAYVRTRHQSLPTLIAFGVTLVAVFALIFVVYSTGFLLKRRNKEFALYGILGLEKKHTRKIICMELLVLFALIAFMAIAGGHIFGKLAFLALNRLMQDVSGRLMDYTFSLPAAAITLLLTLALYIFTALRSSLRISLSTPMQLMQKQHSGEGEPKSRRGLMMLGFITLLCGYGIALTIKGILSSLLFFFAAALLVTAGTYLLFLSFSVIVLKAQKKQKSYFTPARFLSVSGLMHRMKSNAVSLAGIAVMSTGVIIALSATIAIYANIQSTARHTLPRSYQLESTTALEENNLNAVSQALKESVNGTVRASESIANAYTAYSMITPMVRQRNTLTPYTAESVGLSNFLLVYDLAGYNAATGQNRTLSGDEALICSNRHGSINATDLTISGRTFRVTEVDNIIPSFYAVDAYCLIVKDFAAMRHIAEALPVFDRQSQQMLPAAIHAAYNWDVEGISDESYKARLEPFKSSRDMDVSILSEHLKSVYELNGGFLFLGVLVALIFLTGTVLITYYKQINEGFEDRLKYQTMKKVGISDTLIQKTTAAQIVWMFFAPLAVATAHCFPASKIVYQLLGLFGVRHFGQYAAFLLLIIGIFFLVYWSIFKLTSRAYYQIVR